MLTNATERLGFPELFDAREATTNVMANDRRAIVERVGDSLRRYHFGPTAIVATDDAVFGMARMYAMLTDEGGDTRVEVFRDLESAERWLQERSGG